MNLENMLEGSDLLAKKNEIKKIFFFRICGTGMGACACLLQEAGFEVSGADISFAPPMSTYLESTGIECFSLDLVNHEFLQQFDLIVVGNSVPRVSEHSKLIENCGIAFTSFPSILGGFILKDRNVIGLAGTHGKTTTTYFLSQMLSALGEETGYFIGGILNDAPPAQLGKSQYFVIESDEYDSAYFQKYSKFRLYNLNHMILTSLEFDHADIYNNVEEIEEQFIEVFPRMKGYIIANDAYDSIHKLKAEYGDHSWQLYGENSEVGPRDLKLDSQGSTFALNLGEQDIEFCTNIVGKHNILNITACILILYKNGFEINRIQSAVEKLSLVKRRQEQRGKYKGAIVIDDFAHHPKAIDLTIDAIKTKYQDKKILTVFEPISATARSSYFQKEFTQSLEKSDLVILAESSIKTTAKGKENLDCDKIVSDLTQSNVSAWNCRSLADLRSKIDEVVDEQTVLLILSNRTCLGLWESDFVDQIL